MFRRDLLCCCFRVTGTVGELVKSRKPWLVKYRTITLADCRHLGKGHTVNLRAHVVTPRVIKFTDGESQVFFDGITPRSGLKPLLPLYDAAPRGAYIDIDVFAVKLQSL